MKVRLSQRLRGFWGSRLNWQHTQREERQQQDCYDGVQQQKRVTGFCRVLAMARLTACKNSLVTWG